MTLKTAALWHHVPQDIERRLTHCLEAALAQCRRTEGPKVFFRADDIGVPGRQLADMLALFARCEIPLALAVVPAWTTAGRWQALQQMAGDPSDRWCWHQHGWRHQNHEKEGKKQEFGPSRPAVDLRRDLKRGRRRLEAILGKDFTPIFTPPWNRCDRRTLDILAESGYRAVSRFAGSRPAAPPGLTDIAVALDLHTRKESDPRAAWNNLLAELGQSLAEGCCGVMLHHRRMNAAALSFLEILLRSMLRYKDICPMPMPALVEAEPSLHSSELRKR